MTKLAIVVLLAANSLPAQPPETGSGLPLFMFRSGFWVNLHHFLYVLGRAENGAPDSHRQAVAKAPAESAESSADVWVRAIAYYQKNVSPKDAISDDGLVAITQALAAAGDAPSLAGVKIPDALRTALEDAAPVYRKIWWERHARANHARIEELQPLLARYGKPISDTLTKAYQQAWPAEGLTVQVCAYANWAGAYSTAGRLIVIASADEATTGSEGLETMFHEAMHQWDDFMIPKLREAEVRLHVDAPHQLFHSMIFYTAGYATALAVPGHHPYADAMWSRGLPGHAQLDQCWLPYLQGHGTLQDAIDRLVLSFKK